MSPICSSPTRSKYPTSENLCLVNRPTPNNTKGNLHMSAGQERQRQEYQLSLNYCTLRTRLGLGSWKCGRCTKTGTTCPNWILLKQRDQIESLITSMVSLSHESPELVPKVEKLAQLAYCGSHRHKDPRDIRKTKWMTAFPSRPSDIHYLEEQVREVFGPASKNCAAAGMESVPCGKKLGGRKVQNFQGTICEIMKLRIYQSDSLLGYYLAILENNIYCSDHEVTKPLRKQDAWKSRILEIRTLPKSKLGMAAYCELSNEYGCNTGSLDPKDQLMSSLRASSPPDVDENQASCWPEGFDTTPFHIISRRSNRKMATLNDHIQSKVKKKLSPSHQVPGYVYVFEAENIHGYFKIGYTTLPVSERLQNLSFDCNRQLNVLFPTSSESAQTVPNAWRVEELCHAELVDCQVYIDCTGCLCEHKEWFRISAAEAIAVVQKWSKWMYSTPYDPALGSLKEKEKRRILDMDKFKNELAGTATDKIVTIEDIS